MIDSSSIKIKQKQSEIISKHIIDFLQCGKAITHLQCGESDIAWRIRLNPDASKKGEKHADLDSD